MIDRALPDDELARLIKLARAGAPGDATDPQTTIALAAEIRRLRDELARATGRVSELERAETATSREIESVLVDALDDLSGDQLWAAARLAIETIKRLESEAAGAAAQADAKPSPARVEFVEFVDEPGAVIDGWKPAAMDPFTSESAERPASTAAEALDRLEELAVSAIATCDGEGLRGWDEERAKEAVDLAAQIRDAL